MQLCQLDSIHHAAFNKLETKLPNVLLCMLPSKRWNTLLNTLDCTLPVCLTYALNNPPNCTRWHTSGLLDIYPQLSSQDALKYTPCTLLRTPPSIFSSTLVGLPSRTLLIVLVAILPAYWTVHSQVSSQDAFKCTPMYTPKYTLYRQDTPNLPWLYGPMNDLGCLIQRLAELQAPGTGRRTAAAELRMSVAIIVWTVLLAWPLHHGLMMPHG